MAKKTNKTVEKMSKEVLSKHKGVAEAIKVETLIKIHKKEGKETVSGEIRGSVPSLVWIMSSVAGDNDTFREAIDTTSKFLKFKDIFK